MKNIEYWQTIPIDCLNIENLSLPDVTRPELNRAINAIIEYIKYDSHDVVVNEEIHRPNSKYPEYRKLLVRRGERKTFYDLNKNIERLPNVGPKTIPILRKILDEVKANVERSHLGFDNAANSFGVCDLFNMAGFPAKEGSVNFRYESLIRSLEICSRNEWGHSAVSRSIMRALIFEARNALEDLREELENEKPRELSPASKTAFSEHGLAGSFGLQNGPNHGFRPLDLEELEDENDAQDNRLGSLLKRTGL